MFIIWWGKYIMNLDKTLKNQWKCGCKKRYVWWTHLMVLRSSYYVAAWRVSVCPVMLPRAYRGFSSCGWCSSVSKPRFCNCCVWNVSQQFIKFPLLQLCNSCSVRSGLLYSCQLLRTWMAYAEIGLFVLMYRIRSRCLIAMVLLDCPI
jgi:hypothetical protein